MEWGSDSICDLCDYHHYLIIEVYSDTLSTRIKKWYSQVMTGIAVLTFRRFVSLASNPLFINTSLPLSLHPLSSSVQYNLYDSSVRTRETGF